MQAAFIQMFNGNFFKGVSNNFQTGGRNTLRILSLFKKTFLNLTLWIGEKLDLHTPSASYGGYCGSAMPLKNSNLGHLKKKLLKNDFGDPTFFLILSISTKFCILW